MCVMQVYRELSRQGPGAIVVNSFVKSIHTMLFPLALSPTTQKKCIALEYLPSLMLFVYLVISLKRCHKVSWRTIQIQGTPMSSNHLVLPPRTPARRLTTVKEAVEVWWSGWLMMERPHNTCSACSGGHTFLSQPPCAAAHACGDYW